ncbi:hypothetical protein R6Q57_002445 [Mikania cordata]
MKKNRKNLFIRIITTPYRAICKAKDLYIRSITDCANHSTYGMAPVSHGDPLSRTTSSSSFAASTTASEDLRELIRANSLARMTDLKMTPGPEMTGSSYTKQYVMTKHSSPAWGSGRVPRSASVGMGRIDEDVPVTGFPCDEDSGRKVNSDRSMFPRSRSHALTSSDKFNRFS